MVAARDALPSILTAAVERVAESLLADQPHLRIFLFGSRAAGRGGSRSDFDLGIEAGEPLPPDVLDSVREQFETLPLLQKVDVVDFADVDDSFRELAYRDRVPLYER